MAKLTIEIEENEFALYDVKAHLDEKLLLNVGNYTSEEAALEQVYKMVRWAND